METCRNGWFGLCVVFLATGVSAQDLDSRWQVYLDFQDSEWFKDSNLDVELQFIDAEDLPTGSPLIFEYFSKDEAYFVRSIHNTKSKGFVESNHYFDGTDSVYVHVDDPDSIVWLATGEARYARFTTPSELRENLGALSSKRTAELKTPVSYDSEEDVLVYTSKNMPLAFGRVYFEQAPGGALRIRRVERIYDGIVLEDLEYSGWQDVGGRAYPSRCIRSFFVQETGALLQRRDQRISNVRLTDFELPQLPDLRGREVLDARFDPPLHYEWGGPPAPLRKTKLRDFLAQSMVELAAPREDAEAKRVIPENAIADSPPPKPKPEIDESRFSILRNHLGVRTLLPLSVFLAALLVLVRRRAMKKAQGKR